MTCTFRSILSFRQTRGPARCFLGFALLLFALPAIAQTEGQDPALDAPARFLIETITVEGVERAATREIVAKESRISTGNEVDEEDLRQAIYRVKRLPFVIDADFALQKGSERGRYELVIRIEMASSFFVDLTAGATWVKGDASTASSYGWYGAAGARQFVGARGYAFGSIDRDRNLQLGYTQFHLFGPGSYLSAAATRNLEDKNDGYSFALSAGKPITARQVLRAVGSYGGSEPVTSRSIAVEWSFDSTDDPLLPTRGTTLSASAGEGDSKSSFRFSDGLLIRSEARDSQIGALARRYWPLAPRHSLWGELGGTWHDFSGSSEFFGGQRYSYKTGSAAVGYAWDLVRSQVGEPRNDLRLTARAQFDVLTNSESTGFYGRAFTFETALKYRRPQGSIGLTFTYIDPRQRRSVP